MKWAAPRHERLPRLGVASSTGSRKAGGPECIPLRQRADTPNGWHGILPSDEPRFGASRHRLHHRSSLRRLTFRVFFFGTLRADLSTKKSSRLAPDLIAADNHLGCASLPAQTFPDLSRYLIGAFRPLSELTRPVRLCPGPRRDSCFSDC